MNYRQFKSRLEKYFTEHEIFLINRQAFENASETFGIENFSVPDLYNMGREFIIDVISDCESDTPATLRNEIYDLFGIDMIESNAAALLADLESGAF